MATNKMVEIMALVSRDLMYELSGFLRVYNAFKICLSDFMAQCDMLKRDLKANH